MNKLDPKALWVDCINGFFHLLFLSIFVLLFISKFSLANLLPVAVFVFVLNFILAKIRMSLYSYGIQENQFVIKYYYFPFTKTVTIPIENISEVRIFRTLTERSVSTKTGIARPELERFLSYFFGLNDVSISRTGPISGLPMYYYICGLSPKAAEELQNSLKPNI